MISVLLPVPFLIFDIVPMLFSAINLAHIVITIPTRYGYLTFVWKQANRIFLCFFYLQQSDQKEARSNVLPSEPKFNFRVEAN